MAGRLRGLVVLSSVASVQWQLTFPRHNYLKAKATSRQNDVLAGYMYYFAKGKESIQTKLAACRQKNSLGISADSPTSEMLQEIRESHDARRSSSTICVQNIRESHDARRNSSTICVQNIWESHDARRNSSTICVPNISLDCMWTH